MDWGAREGCGIDWGAHPDSFCFSFFPPPLLDNSRSARHFSFSCHLRGVSSWFVLAAKLQNKARMCRTISAPGAVQSHDSQPWNHLAQNHNVQRSAWAALWGERTWRQHKRRCNRPGLLPPVFVCLYLHVHHSYWIIPFKMKQLGAPSSLVMLNTNKDVLQNYSIPLC